MKKNDDAVASPETLPETIDFYMPALRAALAEVRPEARHPDRWAAYCRMRALVLFRQYAHEVDARPTVEDVKSTLVDLFRSVTSFGEHAVTPPA